MVSPTLAKIIQILIVASVVLFALFGFFPGLKDKAYANLETAWNVVTLKGGGYAEGDAFGAPENIQEAFLELVSSFDDASANSGCLLVGKFPELENYQVRFFRKGDDMGAWLVNVGRQRVGEPLILSNQAPCLVVKNAAEGFYTNYLQDNPCKDSGETCPRDFRESDLFVSSENILIKDGAGKVLESYRLNRKNYLFKSDSNHICLIAESGRGSCSYNDKGLKKGCFDGIEDGFINVDFCKVDDEPAGCNAIDNRVACLAKSDSCFVTGGENIVERGFRWVFGPSLCQKCHERFDCKVYDRDQEACNKKPCGLDCEYKVDDFLLFDACVEVS